MMNSVNDRREKFYASVKSRNKVSARKYDVNKIMAAYDFAEVAHEGQTRSSGEPYIIHPVAVATIALEYGMDTDTVCVALLHDVVEDTSYTLEDIASRFGNDVAYLVDGVTKIGKIPKQSKSEQQAENIRKILTATSKDIRVILVKLCDRLHNISTLDFLREDKQRRIAHETMNIYAPIANRLGMETLKETLEDLSFKYLDPFAYQDIKEIFPLTKPQQETLLSTVVTEFADGLKKKGICKKPEIYGRTKSIYSTYSKIYLEHLKIEEIYDIYAIRIIVSNVDECYRTLGLVHSLYRPLPNRFKDYIATPKENMYQSLHTTVMTKNGIIFEVQIRTQDMNHTAEYGIAAHWKYKDNSTEYILPQYLDWINQIIETQSTTNDIEEILSNIKNDVHDDFIVVYTPNGDAIILPKDAIILDFAYKIHSDLGNKAIGAKLNGKIVSTDYKLNHGDICRIIISDDANQGPEREWLSLVKTNVARSKIRGYLKKNCYQSNVIEGKRLFTETLNRNNIAIDDALLSSLISKDDLSKYQCNILDDFFAAIGYGGISISKIMPTIRDRYEELMSSEDIEHTEIEILTTTEDGDKKFIKIDDNLNLSIKYSQCCNPLVGEDVIGLITKNRCLSVHKTSCRNYKKVVKRGDPDELKKWVPVKWDSEYKNNTVPCGLVISGTDRFNFLYDIVNVFKTHDIRIGQQNARVGKDGMAICETTIYIKSSKQLSNIIKDLNSLAGISTVTRIADI